MEPGVVHAFGACELDVAARTLRRGGQPVELQPKVLDLLVYLIEHRERVVSREELLDALWPGVAVTPAALSRAIHKAREAVGDDGEAQDVIETSHGRGFRFVAKLLEERAAGEEAPLAETPVVHPLVAEGSGAERRFGRSARAAAAGLAAALLALIWWYGRGSEDRAPTSPVAPATAIAVLPLSDMSARGDLKYLADGLAEELIHTLAQLPSLRVAARTSAFRFGAQPADIRTVGEQLGVGTVVEGSVRGSSERLRISVQAIRVADGFHLWSATYDRTAADVLSVEREIALAIVGALQLRLTEEARRSLASRSFPTSLAYDLFLRGAEVNRRMDEAGLWQAVGFYRRALEADASFAPAHVALAEAYHSLTIMGLVPLEEGLATARAAVSRALELDDALAEAHMTLGMLRAQEYDWRGAEPAFRRALELEPGNAEVQLAYAMYLIDLGRLEEASVHMDRALELDPLAPQTNQLRGVLHVAMGDFERGIERAQAARELGPALPQTGTTLMYALAASGRDEEALEALLREEADAELRAALHSAYARGGFRAAVRSWLELNVARTGDPCIGSPRMGASWWAFLGDADRAFACLEQAVALHHAFALKTDWMLASLRSDPRFDAVLSKVGLPD